MAKRPSAKAHVQASINYLTPFEARMARVPWTSKPSRAAKGFARVLTFKADRIVRRRKRSRKGR